MAYKRKINNDWTLCYKGKIYQIPPMSKRAPAVKKCTVKETLSGHISITYRDSSFLDLLPLSSLQNQMSFNKGNHAFCIIFQAVILSSNVKRAFAGEVDGNGNKVKARIKSLFPNAFIKFR